MRSSEILDADSVSRTMVWAIDLDDGTLINALGENLDRDKSRILPNLPRVCNLGAIPDDEL